MRIGLIADTHGLLRPEAVRALEGVERIVHAGDLGGRETLAALEAIAPVHAVRGNNDRDAWSRVLPLQLSLSFGGVPVLVLHDAKEFHGGRAVARCRVVISGHSHKPAVLEKEGVLFVNPGSVGPRRFKLPVTVGYLTITRGTVAAEIRELW